MATDTLDFEALTPRAWTLPSGVQLHTVREGQGQPLIFVHGAMGDWRSWAPQWSAFTAQFDCISYSRRYSHPNRNAMPSPNHSALHEAQDLLALMDAMALPQAVLVGSSYGGFTALALAVQAPERVAAVVAVEPPMMKYAERSESGAAVARAFRREVIEPARAAFAAGEDLKASQIMTAGIGGAGATEFGTQAGQFLDVAALGDPLGAQHRQAGADVDLGGRIGIRAGTVVNVDRRIPLAAESGRRVCL